MSRFWSRSFYLKVFGGIFLVGVSCSPAKPDDSIEAIKATGRALFIYSGAKATADDLSKKAQAEIKSMLTEQGILEEAAVVAITAKVISEKRISFEYNGNHYVITPTSVEVKIPL